MIGDGKVLHGEIQQWTVHSKTKQDYVISIHMPENPPPSEGYGVLYVLDGDAYFQLIKEVIRLQAKRSAKTGVSEVIIVGIGYGAKDFHSRRVFDFTPPAESDHLPLRPDGSAWGDTGGAEQFNDFIENELKPAINKEFPVNQENQSLFGHSLGGLFTLMTMMNNPTSYHAYFACSPSIWWNGEALMQEVPAFMEEFEQRQANRDIRLFLAAGGDEKEHLLIAVRKYYEKIKEMEQLSVIYKEIEGENHASIIPTVLSTGLRFLR